MPADYVALDVLGLALQVCLFGVHSVLCGMFVWLRMFKRKFHIVLVICVAFGMILSTVFLGLRARDLSERLRTQTDPTVAVIYLRGMNTLVRIGSYIDITNFLLVDCILIWRLYVVWDRRVIICIPPIVTLMIITAVGFVNVERMREAIYAGLKHEHDVEVLGEAEYSVFLALNIICTTLIAGKIWFQKRRMEVAIGTNTQSSHYYCIIISMMVQSGVIYTLALTALYVIFHNDLQAINLLDGAVFEITGITPIVIVVYLSLGISSGVPTTSTPDIRFSLRSVIPGGNTERTNPSIIAIGPSTQISIIPTFPHTTSAGSLGRQPPDTKTSVDGDKTENLYTLDHEYQKP